MAQPGQPPAASPPTPSGQPAAPGAEASGGPPKKKRRRVRIRDVKVLPPDEGLSNIFVWPAKTTPRGRQRPIPVEIETDRLVFCKMIDQGFVDQDQGVEAFGLLWGYVRTTDRGGVKYRIDITDFEPVETVSASAVRAQVDQQGLIDAMQRLTSEDQGRADKVVGWVHTHPGLGIFFSDMDVNQVHYKGFLADWQIGLVVDPHADKAGFFFWEQGADGRTIETGVQPWREFGFTMAAGRSADGDEASGPVPTGSRGKGKVQINSARTGPSPVHGGSARHDSEPFPPTGIKGTILSALQADGPLYGPRSKLAEELEVQWAVDPDAEPGKKRGKRLFFLFAYAALVVVVIVGFLGVGYVTKMMGKGNNETTEEMVEGEGEGEGKPSSPGWFSGFGSGGDDKKTESNRGDNTHTGPIQRGDGTVVDLNPDDSPLGRGEDESDEDGSAGEQTQIEELEGSSGDAEIEDLDFGGFGLDQAQAQAQAQAQPAAYAVLTVNVNSFFNSKKGEKPVVGVDSTGKWCGNITLHGPFPASLRYNNSATAFILYNAVNAPMKRHGTCQYVRTPEIRAFCDVNSTQYDRVEFNWRGSGPCE